MKTKYSKASGAGGRKIPKTLSGIETFFTPLIADRTSAGKYLKPYQGLKLDRRFDKENRLGAGKYLKPYQGLKRTKSKANGSGSRAGKYLKPYQGLKPVGTRGRSAID